LSSPPQPAAASTAPARRVAPSARTRPFTLASSLADRAFSRDDDTW